MTKKNNKTKYLLLSFIISLPFWWGINVFTEKIDHFATQINLQNTLKENTRILTAEISLNEKQNMKLIPRNIPIVEISAKSGISVLLNENGDSEILFSKNEDLKLPIASITKLMTAIISLDTNNLSDTVKISEQVARLDHKYGKSQLKIGQELTIDNLLHLLLIESNNGAALALAETVGEQNFIDLMNVKAVSLGLEKTFFINPSGLDPENITDFYNYSTAKDISNIIVYSLEKYPLIWEIAGLPEAEIYLKDNTFYGKVETTNQLLHELSIIGGKTGWTSLAQGCLAVVYNTPSHNGYLISIIIGSDNRFEDMKKLIDWTKQAYKF